MNVSDTEIAEIKPDYIILDEFHRCGAELWGAGIDAVLKSYPDCLCWGYLRRQLGILTISVT